jgi:hypothetical protein
MNSPHASSVTSKGKAQSKFIHHENEIKKQATPKRPIADSLNDLVEGSSFLYSQREHAQPSDLNHAQDTFTVEDEQHE